MSPTAENDAARLSRLLFLARENCEMWADVVEGRMNKPATSVRALVAEIDAYRVERGWPVAGFGGESDTRVIPPDRTVTTEPDRR